MIQRVLRNDSRILTFSTARASERWYCLVTFLFFLAWFPCYPLFLFSGQEKTFLQYLVLTASLVFMTVLFGWGAMDCATTPYDEQISFDRALKRVRISTKRMYGSSDDEFRFDQVRAVTVNQGLNLELLTDRGKIEFPTGLDDKDADYDPEDRRHAEAYARMARRAIGLPQGDLPSAPIVRAASSSDEASPQSPGNASRQGYCSSRVIRDDTEVLAWQDQDWTLPCLSIGCIVCPMMFHGSWQRTAELLAICTAASLSVMCCYVHKRMYIFDLVSRRLLLIRKSLLRTRRDELAFDDVLCVKASHRTPQDPLDFLNVQITTVDGRMIDISPMGFCWGPSDQQKNCADIAALFNAVISPPDPEIDELWRARSECQDAVDIAPK